MYKIELSAEHLNYIANVLGRCAYSEALPIITTIQEQLNKQDADRLATPKIRPRSDKTV